MRKFIFIFIAIVVVLAVGYILANRSGEPEDEITALIEHGRQSIEVKSVKDALSCISKDYFDDNDIDYDRLKLIIAQAYRVESRYQATVEVPTITVNDDRAIAKTHVVIAVVNEGERNEVFSGDVVIHLKKEQVRRFLIFPAKDWRIIKLEGTSKLFEKALTDM